MSNSCHSANDPGRPLVYQIKIKGHLGCGWTDWFEGFTLTALDNSEMLLTGPVVDQAALYGILKNVRDVGLPLLSIVRIGPDQTNVSDAAP